MDFLPLVEGSATKPGESDLKIVILRGETDRLLLMRKEPSFPWPQG
jgi:hypothetical protein